MVPRILPAAATVTAAAICAAAFAVPADAQIGSHDPVGSVEKVSASSSTLTVSGWAGDTDAIRSAGSRDTDGGNIPVAAVLDGTHTIARTLTSLARPRVAAAHHVSQTPGFSLSVPLSGLGTKHHTVCVVARNEGMGTSAILKCIPLPLGQGMSARRLAKHDPDGAFIGAWSHPSSVHIRGWADDPDLVDRRTTVVLYLDGSPARTVRTTTFANRPAGAGTNSLFDIRVPVSSGNHVACLWAVNTGLGDGNTYLGCKAIDTRGKAGTRPVTQPKLNAAVVKEAEKHIGARYVWATDGPKTFDCSGLVMYSYHKFGYQTPRVARDQFHAARLIPQSRAVPGDLVFYATSEGYVHHVGVYTGPGMSVAAIDPAEGVDWQRIYPNDTTYYGSFTHS